MSTDEISVDEHKFRIYVVTSLTRLEDLASATAEHLARLNGSVAKHEERINTLTAATAARQAARQATMPWRKRAEKLAWLVLGGIGALVVKEMAKRFFQA